MALRDANAYKNSVFFWVFEQTNQIENAFLANDMIWSLLPNPCKRLYTVIWSGAEMEFR